eukprot:1141149-Pelagomonas_calceolata.AAC.6
MAWVLLLLQNPASSLWPARTTRTPGAVWAVLCYAVCVPVSVCACVLCVHACARARVVDGIFDCAMHHFIFSPPQGTMGASFAKAYECFLAWMAMDK